MLNIKSENSNYLAKVVRLSVPRKHSNADRLQCVTICGNNVITGLDAKENDLYIYFPLESALNLEFLSWSNGFRESEKNQDKSSKGMFEYHGRIKAIKLRGERTEGYIHPAEKVSDWLKECHGISVDFSEHVGTDFDSINDVLLCQKYVNPKVKVAGHSNVASKKKAIEEKIVDGQFAFHADTDNLKRNIHKIGRNDWVSIGYKMHGANAVLSRILCKRKLKWFEKIAKKFGISVNETEYDYVFSSRRVVKNIDTEGKNSYYDSDVWCKMGEKYKESIQDGITLYGEIVGQTPTGQWVQSQYDYGQANCCCEFFVFRITLTMPNGKVYEFSKRQIEEYCSKFGLKVVPFFFEGFAKDIFPELQSIQDDREWHEKLLEKLQEKWNEKDCYMCANKVPEEGIVLRKESMLNPFDAYKLKSFSFLSRESSLYDKGETNMEDMEVSVEDSEDGESQTTTFKFN